VGTLTITIVQGPPGQFLPPSLLFDPTVQDNGSFAFSAVNAATSTATLEVQQPLTRAVGQTYSLLVNVDLGFGDDTLDSSFTLGVGSLPTPPPTVQFSAGSEMINESAGTFSVAVVLSTATTQAVSVPFTLGGTAANGTDYSIVTASPLVIAAGQTSGTITGTLLPDPGASPTLVFTLGSPSNATLGSTTSTTLTITEPTATPTPTPSGIGAFDSASGMWYLRNERNAGAPDAGQFAYGLPNWEGVVGDWNGDGVVTVGVVNPLGVFATWYLRNENSPGGPDVTGGMPFVFGFTNWLPLAGDWTGSGHTGIGMFDPSSNTFYLENDPGSGKVDFLFQYGAPGWIPVAGDWNHSGHAGIGMVDPKTMTWYLRNEVGAGAPDAGQFVYGFPGWRPVVGDWNGDGKSTVGLFAPETFTFYLRNENNAGAPDAGQFAYGFSTWAPVAGAWSASKVMAADGRSAGTGLVEAGDGILASEPVILDAIFADLPV
jgi:hypothetical protein